MPNTTRNRPTAERTAPIPSKDGRSPVRGGSSIRRARNAIPATTTTCSRNDARQLT
jgi:hypothetical protein